VKVNKKDNNVLNWERLAELFNAKSVRVMSAEEYEREFDTKFPAPDPTPHPARPKIVDPWIKVAEEILERDFCEEPIDRSTRKSLMIGLQAKSDPSSRAALARLKQTKPVVWSKSDVIAGKLLPRRKWNQ
jgi:hypothetical protein